MNFVSLLTNSIVKKKKARVPGEKSIKKKSKTNKENWKKIK